ncbi:MAG: nuclear transport factor 2 family protein [Treponema sp.]|nr:nuclear transport factor 2 family protein [Treponema sp.]
MNDDPYVITSLEQFTALWSQTYNREGKPDWSHIIPYYDEAIHFRDCIQEVQGLKNFRELTERLTKRSQDLSMAIKNAVMQDRLIYMEWEMTILFRNTRSSVVYGASRILLNERGKIVDQRDYYDLWGDIFDNIPGFNRMYRSFMRRVFG